MSVLLLALACGAPALLLTVAFWVVLYRRSRR